jgi:hypothetical protein
MTQTLTNEELKIVELQLKVNTLEESLKLAMGLVRAQRETIASLRKELPAPKPDPRYEPFDN